MKINFLLYCYQSTDSNSAWKTLFQAGIAQQKINGPNLTLSAESEIGKAQLSSSDMKIWSKVRIVPSEPLGATFDFGRQLQTSSPIRLLLCFSTVLATSSIYLFDSQFDCCQVDLKRNCAL